MSKGPGKNKFLIIKENDPLLQKGFVDSLQFQTIFNAPSRVSRFKSHGPYFDFFLFYVSMVQWTTNHISTKAIGIDYSAQNKIGSSERALERHKITM